MKITGKTKSNKQKIISANTTRKRAGFRRSAGSPDKE
jgi:hypothetical protein